MFWAALLTFVVATAAPSTDAPPLSEARIEQYSLDNGLRVVLYRDERYPVVESRVVYDVGTGDDPPEKVGLAHLAEHVVAVGGVPGTDGARSHLFSRGVSNGAYTEPTTTTYWATGPASHVDLVLWLESKRMRGTTRFTPALLEKQRRIVKEEMTQRLFGGIRERELGGMLDLLATSGDRRLVSTNETLARITAADIEELVRENYVPANATLVLAGDLPNDIDARIEDYFGELAPGAANDDARAAAASLPKSVQARARGLVPGAIALWTIPGAYADGDAAARVLATLLEASSPADESSSVVRIQAAVFRIVGESALFVRVDGTSGAQPSQLLAELDAILVGVSSAATPPAQARAASRRALVQMRAEVGTLAGCADRLADYVAAARPVSWLAEEERRVAAVDPAMLAAFAKSWLVARPRIVLLVEGDGAR